MKKLIRKKILCVICLFLLSLVLFVGCKAADETRSTLSDYKDETAPTVVSTLPVASSSDLNPETTQIKIVFSEKMDAASFSSNSIYLNGGSSDIAGSITIDEKTVIFSPSQNIQFNKSYTGNISTNVKDIGGQAITKPYSWSFYTSAFKAGASSKKVIKNFKRTIDLTTDIQPSSGVTYIIGTNPAHGSVSVSGTKASYTPTSNYIGTDSFTYKARTAYGDSIEATVSLTVKNGSVVDTGQTTSYTATAGEDSDYTNNPPSYTDNGNGTITDNVTDLVWQQTDDDTTRDWASAGTYCDNLTLGSQSDWQLPTVKELSGILNLGGYNPSINAVFTGTNSSSYWSSTTRAYNTSYAWYVYFGNGFVHSSYKTNNYVRCVRGGQ